MAAAAEPRKAAPVRSPEPQSEDSLTIARLQGQIAALNAQIAALEATDEHRRIELAGALAEAAEARAAARESQARLEERNHVLDGLRDRVNAAEAAQAQADRERAAVIAGMGWRARRQLRH